MQWIEKHSGALCRALLDYQAFLCCGRIRSTRPDLYPGMKDTLTYQNPLIMVKSIKSVTDFFLLIFNISLHGLSGAYMLSFIEVLVLEYRRGTLYLNWNPKANSVETNCNVSDPMLFDYQDDLVRFQSIISISKDIENSMNFMKLSNGTSIMAFATLTCAIAGYFFAGIITASINARINFISFLCDPCLERCMADKEIRTIFRELLDSINNTVTNSNLRFDSPDRNQESLYRESLRGASYVRDKGGGKLSSEKEIIKKRYKTIYTNLILDIKNMNLVKPVILSQNYYNKTAIYYITFIVSMAVMGVITVFFLISLYIFEELNKRVSTRLSQLNCNSNTPILNYIYHGLLDQLSAEDEIQFILFDSTKHDLWAYIYLILIESKYYLFKHNTIFKYVSIGICGFYCNVIVWFFGSLFIFAHIERKKWIEQITDGLMKCINLMNELNESRKNLMDAPNNGERNLKLYRQLVVTYVNFELFRRQNRDFQRFIAMVITQEFIMAVPVLYISWLMQLIPLDSKMLIAVMLIYVVVYLNCYLLLSAMLTGKIENVRRQILRLLAASKLNSFQYTHILDSWLRQITSPEETNQLFAPKLHGFMVINYTNVISINGYIVAIFCLLSLKL